MIFGLPIQFIFVLIIYKQREKGVKITDTRVRLTTEVRLQFPFYIHRWKPVPRFYKGSGS